MTAKLKLPSREMGTFRFGPVSCRCGRDVQVEMRWAAGWRSQELPREPALKMHTWVPWARAWVRPGDMSVHTEGGEAEDRAPGCLR